MALEPCNRCGATDPQQMIGLMSRWFAVPAGLDLQGGYFYLCPPCFAATVQPYLDQLLDELREHLPPPHRSSRDGMLAPPAPAPAPPAAAPSPPPAQPPELSA